MANVTLPRRWEETGVASVRLTMADRGEILRYLGYSGQKIDEITEQRLNDGIARLNKAAAPKLIASLYSCDESGSWPDALTFLTGKDIREHLKGCREILLMGATIGAGVDRALHVEEVRDAAGALIMDAAGSALIEAVCDSFEALMRGRAQKAGRYLTTRFSPGYGDLPLAVQNRFADLIEARRIGLAVTPEHIMVPRKSVTAIIGISDHPLHRRSRSCDSCNMRESCRFRKAGVVCGE
ncbi:MAG: vitamin B12 dependent methionine synthase, activation domain protein [Lachnospiraceae bacterium]|jgi:hypothetical protein